MIAIRAWLHQNRSVRAALMSLLLLVTLGLAGCSSAVKAVTSAGSSGSGTYGAAAIASANANPATADAIAKLRQCLPNQANPATTVGQTTIIFGLIKESEQAAGDPPGQRHVQTVTCAEGALELNHQQAQFFEPCMVQGLLDAFEGDSHPVTTYIYGKFPACLAKAKPGTYGESATPTAKASPSKSQATALERNDEPPWVLAA
jgi:hypothetical protein